MSTEFAPMNAALYAVRRGWKIVPAKVTKTGGKKNVEFLVKWGTGSTNDFDQVRDWWVQYPNATVGVLTKANDLLVVDLDKHAEGQDGEAEWLRLVGEHGGGELPETFTVRTPSGGLHLYFTNTDQRLKNSASKLASGVDVRGAGGNAGGIVFFGCLADGAEYTIENDGPVAELPRWLHDLLLRTVPTKSRKRDEWVQPNSERKFTEDQARKFTAEYALSPLMVASEGERNNSLNNAAICMGHFGPEFWPTEEALNKLRDVARQIGLEANEIEQTIQSGYYDAEWHATLVTKQEAEDVSFKEEVAREVRRREVRAEADKIMKAKTKRVSLAERILTREELKTIPGVEPLISNFLFRRSVAVLYGRRNVGKTFVSLDMALSIATGQAWAGDVDDVEWIIGQDQGFNVHKGKVLWVAGEGAYGIRARVEAWEKQHSLEAPDFFVLNGSVELADGDVTDELCERVAAEGYDLVVIDTLARNSNGLEENSATDMGTFFERIDRIKNAHDGTCVLVVHHAGKGDSVESRGSTVIEDAPDSVFKLSGDEIHISFETVKQRDTVKHRKLSFHLQAVDGTPSAVALPGRGYVASSEDSATASVEMQVREIFMSHFENTGCTGAEWKAAIVEKLAVSRPTAQRYMNAALEGWDAITTVDQGKGKSPRYEVA